MATSIEPIGQTQIEVVRDLLIGERDFKEAVGDIRGRAVSPEKDDENAPVLYLFKRYYPHPTCAKIARKGADKRVSPALQLFVKKNKWYIEPFLLRPEFLAEEDRYSVLITDHWIDVLLRYVEEEFSGVGTKYNIKDTVVKQLSQEKDFEERIRRFKRSGPNKFFSDGNVAELWMIVSLWDDWNRAPGLDWNNRHAQLAKMGYACEFRYFQQKCKALGLVYVAPRAGIGGRRK